MRVYRFTGGIRIGDSYWLAANASVPLAYLSITSGDLCFQYPLTYRDVILPRGAIERISCKRHLMGFGIRVIHHAAEVMPFIIFWTFYPEEIMAVLRQMAYPVADNKTI